MRLVPLLPALLLAGCASFSGSDADAVRLHVEPTTVSPGDALVLVLDNESAERVGYNLCTSTLEQHVGGAWRPVESDRVCTMELRMLEPGAEARYTLDVPAVPPGEYRAVTGVERMESGGRATVASEPFRVEA